MTKIDSLADFRIDFDAIAALIALAHRRILPVMPADLPSSPVPLAEISQGPNAFDLFLDRNHKNLIILAILLAIGVAALVVYRGVEKSRQETAGAALDKAEDVAALQAVITEHAGTAAAASAMILLADRQWTDGQQDPAIETLHKFIAANPDHPALPTAQASLGSKLMLQGKTAEASQIFQALVDAPKAHFIAPYALVSLGDLAKISGDLSKAEAAYTRVKNDFPESNYAEIAKRRITALRTKPPVEIAPPPPAPAAPKTDVPPFLIPPPATTPATGAPVVPATATPPADPVAPTPPPATATPPATPVAPATPTTGTPPVTPVAPAPPATGTPPTAKVPPVKPAQESPPKPRNHAAPISPAAPKR